MENNKEPLKLFISYSHADESYLKEFKSHLATLERNKEIQVWNDRELVTGDKLEEEIHENLLEADLITFLISSDFLSSFYCFEIELGKTLARINSSNIRVIPVIVRPCDWKSTVLGDYLASTRDGKEISKFENRDDAWLEVVNSIKKSALKLLDKTKKEIPIVEGNIDNITLNSTFEEYLNDTEIKFSHNNKENIYLKDIYVHFDLKNMALQEN